MPSSRFADFLIAHQAELLGFCRRHASPAVLRYEAAEDLLQGIWTQALESEPDWQEGGEAAVRAWIFRLARNFLIDRTRYWMALKRRSSRVLRFEMSRSDTSSVGMWEPRASQTSPSQFAVRREQLVTAAKAMDLLLERDRQLVTWAAHKIPLSEQASRLGTAYDATAQASRRAQKRFRDVYRLIVEGELGL